MLDLQWLTVFIDHPSAVFGRGSRFWQEVTGSTLSAKRGQHQEFATLLPADGDPYLRVQRTDEIRAKLHLDLHVGSIPDAHEHAVMVGAQTVAERGYVVLRSPGGIEFCLVGHDGESVRPGAVEVGAPNLVDQVCIDMPRDAYEAESDFWQSLTGWQRRSGALDEFEVLVRPDRMPIRLLLQKLDDQAGTVGAHLDVACGPSVAAVAEAHRRHGAQQLAVYEFWTTMRDPAGLSYCLTARDPESGLL